MRFTLDKLIAATIALATLVVFATTISTANAASAPPASIASEP